MKQKALDSNDTQKQLISFEQKYKQVQQNVWTLE